jgi:hypothetical protein
MEVDYDVYAEGEAELGWLNCQTQIQSAQPLELDRFLLALVSRLHQVLIHKAAEAAHLKVIGMTDGVYAVANLISNETQPVLSLSSHWTGTKFDLVLNARVAIDPEELETLIREALQSEAEAFGATTEIHSLQCFRPGRPVPTHRLQ